MATISFFAGWEIKDATTALRVLEALREPGEPIPFTDEERGMFRRQEDEGKKLLNNIEGLLIEL